MESQSDIISISIPLNVRLRCIIAAQSIDADECGNPSSREIILLGRTRHPVPPQYSSTQWPSPSSITLFIRSAGCTSPALPVCSIASIVDGPH